ncbi:uncharacterized protein LOC142333512 isoform X2 [Lycorma delicatula]|uniref:uncharacterized protein LOC142333512 isoform X2 n=1 Tax=Lycorma delicatula TaxID=130591 RepID=UPI003F51638D
MMLKLRMIFILICCFTSVKQTTIKMQTQKPGTQQPAKSTASKEQPVEPVITMQRSTSEQASLSIAYINSFFGRLGYVNYYSTYSQYFGAARNPFLRISFDRNTLNNFSKDQQLVSGFCYNSLESSNINIPYQFPSTSIKWTNLTGTDNKSTAKVFVTIYNQNNEKLTPIPSVRMLSRIDEVKNTVKIADKKSNGLGDACFNMAVIINN